MEYKMVSEVSAPTKIWKFFILKDLAVIAAATAFGWLTKDMVNKDMQIFYMIFNAVIGLVLVLPSPFSGNRRMYQLILYTVTRNKGTFHSLAVNNKRIPKATSDMYFEYNPRGD